MNAKNKAIIQMVVCAAMWSIAGIFIKHIQWNGFVIAGWRSFFALVTTLVYAKAAHVKLHFTKRSVLNGIFLSLTFMAFVVSNKLTTAANAIVLEFTAPIFLMVYSSLLFRQKFRTSDVLAAIFTLAGIALFFFDQLSPGHLLGNFVAIAAGAFMAAMYLFVGSGEESDRFSGTLLGHAFTAAVGIPFMFFTENTVDTRSVLFIIILGVFQLGVPYILFVLSTRACPPLACSLLGAVEPLLNPVWVAIFDGEVPGIFALIGAIVVIVTVTAWCMWKDKHPQNA
ncbi:MAG: EamA family transporter [Oscillospiraceae bacterium]|nr:EamA family transporter [Oscillospiraceae bacterium]